LGGTGGGNGEPLSPADPGALRLFIGLRLSLDAAAAIADVAAGLRRSMIERGLQASWAAPAGLHVTLAFLGATRPEAALAVVDRVGAALAGARGLALRTAGLGCFPSTAKASVLWVGVEDPDRRLADLAARVAGASHALGFKLDRRPFHPHVTLARMRAPTDLREVVATPPERLRSETWLHSVALLESIRTSSSSEYSVRAEWILEAGSKAPRRQTRAVERSPDDSDPPGRTGGESEPRNGPGEIDHGDQGHRGDDGR
jgi:2'-5' RNA ligase